ncbi:Tautomerase/MIF [Amylocystis lapponica]|nr:Tautomerase/MIF [Amylocystis lapponica]
MPAIELKTNVAVADPKAFVVELSELSSTVLDKALPAVCASYTYVEHLAFHGTFEPAFLLVITSLGNLGPAENEAYSKAYFEFFEKKLGVVGTRGYITFVDPGMDYLAVDGMTATSFFVKRKAEAK